MTSRYLLQPTREYEEVVRLRDGQIDIYNGDSLQRALHEQIATGHFWRDRTREMVASMKRRWAGGVDILDWAKWFKDMNWLREARRAHSKAILNREAYQQMISEREIQRELRLL